MKNNLLITTSITIVVGVVGFFAGTKYQNTKQSSSTMTKQLGNGRFGNRQGSQSGNDQNKRSNRLGPRQIIGEILSQDDKSITVKLEDGSSKIVFLADTTTVSQSSTAKQSDLKVGGKVAVFGPENTDGSVIATNIQLNPISRGMMNAFL